MSYQKEIKTAIDLISISVRTAPKSGGIDDIVFLAASKQQKDRIAKAMCAIGREKSRDKFLSKEIKQAIETSWVSDARTVMNSQGLILIGTRGKKAIGFNCGGCGFKSCAEFNVHNFKNKDSSIQGPFCIFKICDLGIAIDSAAKTASMLNVDNRIMYRIGTAALRLKLFKDNSSHKKLTLGSVNPILGLPLSVSGKNIYFDRLDKLQAAKVLTDYFRPKK
jgi:uncharacterized ferredoxin-like protein